MQEPFADAAGGVFTQYSCECVFVCVCLTVKGECVCMNGHQTWRPVLQARSLFVQHTQRLHGLSWSVEDGVWLRAAAHSLISRNGLLGMRLTSHKPSAARCAPVCVCDFSTTPRRSRVACSWNRTILGDLWHYEAQHTCRAKYALFFVCLFTVIWCVKSMKDSH